MSVAVIALCFLSALLLTLLRGAGSAFVFAYLPALLLLSQLPALALPGIPDARAPTAAVYGILLGGLWGGRLPHLRMATVDYIVVALLLTHIISALTTGTAYAAVSVLGTMGLRLVAPYFIVRCTFERRDVQRQALVVLIAVFLVVGLFSFIEMRLWPNTYRNLLLSLGLAEGEGPGMALRRYGFFRAHASFFHAIDLGNGAALVFASIAILAWRTATDLRNLWVVAGLAAAFVAWISAISFGSLLGSASGFCLYVVLSTFRRSRYLPVAGVASLIFVGFALTAYMANTPLGERPPATEPLAQSYWVREVIVHRSWHAASTAGLFGWGFRLDEVLPERGSTDNAYLLILIREGWVALVLWLALPVCLATLASTGLRKTRSRTHAHAILAGFSAVVGIMISMFTVFFGFIYASLLLIVVALTVNTAQAAGGRDVRRRPSIKRRAWGANREPLASPDRP